MMTTSAQRLRQKLLDLAIRGKLVPQNPKDEPAEKLLARIRSEKAKLIAEKKIKKEKPLPSITDDEKPFDLPLGWIWVRWGDLSESIQYGYNAPAKKSGKIRMVRITDVQNGAVQWRQVPFCDIPDSEIDDYLLRPGDILFARTGGTVGKSYIVTDVPERAIYAGYLIRTRYDARLVPEYFKFFMESQLYWQQLHEGTIATAQPNCNGKTLARMMLPLPPLAEQKRIVAALDTLLKEVDAVAAGAKRIAALKDKARAKILDLAIRGKLVEQDATDEPAEKLLARIRRERNSDSSEASLTLRHSKKTRNVSGASDKSEFQIPDDERPFDIPQGWAWCRLGEIIELISGVSYQKSDIADKGIRILRGGNLKEDHKLYLRDDDVYVSPNLKDRSNTVRADDVVIVSSTGSASVIGRPAIATTDYDNVQIGAFLRIARARARELARWSHVIFVGDYYRNHIRELAKGTNIKNLKSEYILDMPIPLPPLAEQRRIVTKVDEMLAACDNLASEA